MADVGMVGRHLSHYRIRELLGSGGMGEVYRATDVKLLREVALKILPRGLPRADAERRRLKFRKECRALSRVAHPHVATLFDFGTSDGVDFLVMELLPGPTLEMLLRSRRLQERETVRIASQLVRGLQAAHAIGVVHRDIKPSNIAFTADGLLKVLDFGLAKLTAMPSTGAVTAATVTDSEFGVVAGSLPYMSPEQLLGQEVDGRSDLYSVGAVLYEMVTGRRPFGSAKGVELTDAILHRVPPPPRTAGALVSPGLQALILKLLDKDPQLRYQSAGEVLVDLERLERDVNGATVEGVAATGGGSSPRRSRIVAGVVGTLALVVSVVVSMRGVRELRPPEPAPAASTGLSRGLTPLTTSPASERYPALSPSGRRLAFVADGRQPGNTDVYVQDVGSHRATALTNSRAPECCVTWAPDERSVAFVRLTEGQGSIMVVPAGGGVERRLASLTAWFGTALSFSPDGRTLAYPNQGAQRGPFSVRLLSLDTLESRRLTEPSDRYFGDALPVFSPDGKWLAFSRVTTRLERADVYVVPASGGEARRLTRAGLMIGGLDWTPDGRAVMLWAERSNAGRMWRIGLDGGEPTPYWPDGDLLGPSRFVEAAGLATVSSAYRFSVARSGGRMALTQSLYDTDIWRLRIGERSDAAGPSPPLIASTQTDDSPQFSPDGLRIAFASLRSGRPQIWICDQDGANCAPLLTASDHDGTPRWSPDGRKIAFDARPEERSRIHVVRVENRLVRTLTEGRANDVVPSWSRDGRWVYFASDRTGSWQVHRVPAEGGPAQQVTLQGGFAAFESPANSDRLLYTRVDSPGLWTVPVSGGRETRLLEEPRCWGQWAIGGGGVYVAATPPGQLPTLLQVDPETAHTRPVAELPRSLPCGESALAVSPDGRLVLYSGIRESSDLVLVQE